MKEDLNCNFGVQIQFTTNLAMLQKLFPLLELYDSILLKSEIPENGYLFRQQSITPDHLFDYGFQIKTKKLITSMQNYNAVGKLLLDLQSTVSANETCAIHVHFSRNDCDLRDHYIMLYQLLGTGIDKKYLYLQQYNMSNQNYASYTGCRKRYLHNINRDIKKHGKFTVNNMYYSKQYLYTINSVYNTIEYRGLRWHFMNKVSIVEIHLRILEVLDCLISMNVEELNRKYKKQFIYEQEL